MNAVMATPEQAESALRLERKEIPPGNHPNKFSEQRNLYIAEGDGVIITDGKEEIIQKGWIYMFSQGETVEFRVKDKLVVYSA